jgi:hypothetical protein
MPTFIYDAVKSNGELGAWTGILILWSALAYILFKWLVKSPKNVDQKLSSHVEGLTDEAIERFQNAFEHERVKGYSISEHHRQQRQKDSSVYDLDDGLSDAVESVVTVAHKKAWASILRTTYNQGRRVFIVSVVFIPLLAGFAVLWNDGADFLWTVIEYGVFIQFASFVISYIASEKTREHTFSM